MTTLTPLTLPDADEGWEPWLRRRCTEQLDHGRALVVALKEEPDADGPEVMTRWNEVNLALSNALAVSSLLAQVHPAEPVRTAAEQAEQEARELLTEIGLDRGLFEVLDGVDRATFDTGRLGPGAARVLERSLRDFRRAGVDLDDDARGRIRTLARRESELGQTFSKNIRDDVRSVVLRPEQLAGLPADYVERHPVAADGMVTVTTDYPDYVPFMTFAHDREARAALLTAFLNRAWPDNDAVLGELLRLRREHATLLGYADWPDYDAEVKMIGTGESIAQFIDRITEAADGPARRDYQVLLDRMRQDRAEATSVDSVDKSYYGEVVRRERFDVDAQEVRTYLDHGRVRAGLLEVTGRLFGLEYTEVSGAPRWHEDVVVYDVSAEGEQLGRIYLDLHPREGKYKHAAQFDLTPGVAGRQFAEGVLVCNFPRGLMEHDDVVTLFH